MYQSRRVFSSNATQIEQAPFLQKIGNLALFEETHFSVRKFLSDHRRLNDDVEGFNVKIFVRERSSLYEFLSSYLLENLSMGCDAD